MSQKELNYYYLLGKSGNMNFKWFYDAFLAIKIDKYVKSVLSKKSHKIALKNSGLSIDEFKSNQEFIEVPQTQLVEDAKSVKFIIRSGELGCYSNVIFESASGVLKFSNKYIIDL